MQVIRDKFEAKIFGNKYDPTELAFDVAEKYSPL